VTKECVFERQKEVVDLVLKIVKDRDIKRETEKKEIDRESRFESELV